MSALVAYFEPSPLAGPRRTRMPTIVSGALIQILVLQGHPPTSNSFAQPIEGSATRTAPPLVIETTPQPTSTAEAVLELRRLSGLTWDELAYAFDVSRRALHHWASGSSLAPAHLQHVHQALYLVQRASHGASAALRERFLTPLPSGDTALDLMRARNYSAAEQALGRKAALPATSVAAGPADTHPPLVAALSTLEDRPFQSVRSSRVARTIRVGKANEPR